MIRKNWILIILICIFMSNISEYSSKRLDYYIRILSGPPGERRVALDTLGLMKEPRAIPYISKILREEYDPKNKNNEELFLIEEEKQIAISCLGRIGHPDGIIPIVEFIVRYEDRSNCYICIKSLEKIDPNWMKRPDVKSYIPQCISIIRKKFELDNCYWGHDIATPLLFLNKTALQEAIPFNIKLIKKYGDTSFSINTLEIAAAYLDCNYSNDKEFLEGCRSIIREIFILYSPLKEQARYLKVLDKLYPGWKQDEVYFENILDSLKKIEDENYGRRNRINYIDTLKLLDPSSLEPVLEYLINNPETDMDIKNYAISVRSEIKKISSEVIIPDLTELSKEKDNDRIYSILTELIGITPNPPIDTILKVLSYYDPSNKGSFQSRIGSICQVLSRINDPRILDYIIKVYPQITDSNYKYSLLENLSQHYDDRRLLPIFKQELDNPDIRIRAIAEYGVFKFSSKYDR